MSGRCCFRRPSRFNCGRPAATAPCADIVNGAQPPLPAFPVRVACEHLADAELASDALRLLRALRDAVAVFYNHTGDLGCFSFKQGPNPETGERPCVCSAGCLSLGVHCRHLQGLSTLPACQARIPTAACPPNAPDLLR